MEICLIAPDAKAARSGEPRSPLFPPLGLLTVAALTPPEHKVRVVDEALEDVDLDMSPDLIGLTATTAQAPRAYELADHFRRRGITVVIGGMHASALPAEALRHCDAVVVGEAEGLWPRLLNDLKHRRLQRIYRHETPPDPALIPAARRDLVNLGAYVAGNTVQASRGCPFACRFCSVTRFFGARYRTRPLDDVVAEISELPAGPVMLVDDNIIGQRIYAHELFARLAELRRDFIGQISTTVLNYPKLIAEAARAGFRALFVGLESISQTALSSVGKGFNTVERYKELVTRFHDHGVSVIGSFMFGLDGDEPDVFQRTVDFAHLVGIDFVLFSIATPLPATGFYADLLAQGRIQVPDWSKYDGTHCVFRPANMTPAQLENGLRRAYRAFYLSARGLKSLMRHKDVIGSLLRREYRRRIRRWLRDLLNP